MVVIYRCNVCRKPHFQPTEAETCEARCRRDHQAWVAGCTRRCAECGVANPVFSRHEPWCISNLF